MKTWYDFLYWWCFCSGALNLGAAFTYCYIKQNAALAMYHLLLAMACYFAAYKADEWRK